MECIHCHKIYASTYSLKIHQTTAKYCLLIQESNGSSIERKKEYECSYCFKTFTANTRLHYHLGICKTKRTVDIEAEKIIKIELEQKVEIEKRLRKLNEDKLNELIQKFEDKNKDIDEIKKTLEEKSTQPTIINNQITNNHHLTIFTSMSPERVTDMFTKHYTIDTLMGGQKALADFVVDRFVSGQDGMVYLCVDRSRKKVCYTTDFLTYKEDMNCETLIQQLTPAFPLIKAQVDYSEFEKKYNPHVDTIHKKYDEILAIRTDGTTFRGQLCRRLPATIEDKDRMDSNMNVADTLNSLRHTEEKQYEVRKDEIERIETKAKETSKPTVLTREPEPELVWNNIHGIGLGKLDVYRLLFKNKGIYKIMKELEDVVANDPEVSFAYEEYVQRGSYRGKVIWE